MMLPAYMLVLYMALMAFHQLFTGDSCIMHANIRIL